MDEISDKIPFDSFWETLTETNATLDSFVDFVKAESNVERVSIRLNQLNYLLGKDALDDAVRRLFKENPAAFDVSVFEILIAVRDGKNRKILDEEKKVRFLRDFFDSADSVLKFIYGTGLADVFRDRKISNLTDYVFGIEVGLDSNTRKNRSGAKMAEAVARRFGQAGIAFRTEVESSAFPKIQSLGTDLKRFDFVVETRLKTYLIEVNYYNSNGSKPNEVARAYSELAPKIGRYPEFEFVWITDGNGWRASKNKIQEAYRSIRCVFNLKTLDAFISRVKSELHGSGVSS